MAKKKEPKEIKGNTGEWSEFYTFLKLLAEGRIHAADKFLNKREELFYLVLKIIRGRETVINYSREENVIISNADTNELLGEVSAGDIQVFAANFLKGIQDAPTGEGSYTLPCAKEVFEIMRATEICDNRRQTADVRIVIHDPITQFEPLLGFSVKSYLRGKPTLFNASKSTNILYKITPKLNQIQVDELNRLPSYGKRLTWLVGNNFDLEFVEVVSDIFETNLELIDSRLPEILANMVKSRFLRKRSTKLTKLIELLNEDNPCGFNLILNPGFYDYKVRRLLVDAALGMTAGTLWNGQYNANGGYIAVKKDGELVCYHIYNWNDFQDYLVSNTKFETPDSGEDRCDYGRIIRSADADKVDETFIKLNFQIRFT